MNQKTKQTTARQTITPEIKNLVAQATFTIRPKKGGSGQCVLIEGGLIITAAHCVSWDCGGEMVLGDFYLEKIATAHGDLTATVLAVEPVSDLAVLGCPDSQTFSAPAKAFDEFCERITPLRLYRRPMMPFKPMPVWILSHLKTWIPATATYFGSNADFSFDTTRKINGGTSGGPIVNRAGELVGVVSHTTEDPVDGEYCSSAPLLSLALPAWVIQGATEIAK
jgi:hypothetical protein